MALTCCLCPWSGPHPFLLQESLPKAHSHTFWAGRLWEVSQPFSRTQLLGRCAHSCRQTSSRSGWGEDGRGESTLHPITLQPVLAPHSHICLVEKWVGPKEQIYCVPCALGSIPAARNWSEDKDECVWLQAQSLRQFI